MSFPLKDVRYQTRRTKDEDDSGGVAESRTLYPRLLRDRAVLPKVEIAVQYFESLEGRERREMDAEVLVQFFGDHKLARCVVAALATSYRYRSPDFPAVCSPSALRRLERAGAGTPKALRALLYGRLNGKDGSGDGFLRRADRPQTFATLERSYALRAGQLEHLLYLDADEHAILRRTGPPPSPLDVVAQYNFGILETLLRHAETVELLLTDAPGRPALANASAGLQALGQSNGVQVTLAAQGAGALRARLSGRSDALGSWARHGRRVARTVVQALERGRGVVAEGSADVVLRDRRAVLRLTSEVLDHLSPGAAPDAGWDELPGWDAGAIEAGLSATRAALTRRAPPLQTDEPGDGEVVDASKTGAVPPRAWGLRRLPEPQAWAAGVLVPDLRLVQGADGVRLCAVRSAGHGRRLATIAPRAPSGEPVLFLGHPEAVAPLLSAGLPAAATPEVDLRPLLPLLDASVATQACAGGLAPSSRRRK
jgi:hypothetical protein